jgi:hypothetical protein
MLTELWDLEYTCRLTSDGLRRSGQCTSPRSTRLIQIILSHGEEYADNCDRERAAASVLCSPRFNCLVAPASAEVRERSRPGAEHAVRHGVTGELELHRCSPRTANPFKNRLCVSNPCFLGSFLARLWVQACSTLHEFQRMLSNIYTKEFLTDNQLEAHSEERYCACLNSILHVSVH